MALSDFSKKAPEIGKKIPVPPKGTPWRGVLIYLILAFLGLLVVFSFSSPVERFRPGTPLSQLLNEVRDGKVEKIVVDGDRLIVTYRDSRVAFSRKEEGESFVKTLETAKIDPSSVQVDIKDRSFSQAWVTILTTFLPLALMIGFFFLIFRQAREGAGSIFSFGQSRAKLFSRDTPKISFADVAGVDEAKQELTEVVDFLKHAEKFKAVGARTPKGVLLVGAAGTGKTLLAKAVAGEAGVPFFSVAGSEFMEMLVGVGAARVRDLFMTAKRSAPAIIFVDEIESIGRMRGFGFSGGHDEREQTLNQILVEMDGFTPNDNVIVLAATNRPDLLDPALIRPGRFDRRVVLDMPDIEGRKAILKIHQKGKPFEKNVDWERIAKRTIGFTGADLANMLNEAAILTARAGKKEIDAIDLEEAATKVKLGPQRKRIQTDEERRMTAYHEAGHAIVAHFLPHMDPVHRISIVSRGITGGHTMIPPQVDRQTETKTHLLEMIATFLGGRAAEELEFADVTTGAASDLSLANQVTRQMVTEFGMSSLGPITAGPKMQFGMWPADLEGQATSQDLAGRIDKEVQKIIEEAESTAQKILSREKTILDKVASALLEKETLEGEEFEKLVGKKVGKNSEMSTTQTQRVSQRPRQKKVSATVPT